MKLADLIEAGLVNNFIQWLSIEMINRMIIELKPNPMRFQVNFLIDDLCWNGDLRYEMVLIFFSFFLTEF